MSVEEIVRLVEAMDQGEWDGELVRQLCRAAGERLERSLRPGLRPQDCGGAFPVAAAWLALGWLYDSGGAVESFSAGDLTVRANEGQRSRQLREGARRLMAPYQLSPEFAVRGTKG